MKKRSQISVEYLILMGFLTFVIIVIISIAFFYIGNMRDKTKDNLLNDCGNKIISASETVFYAGEPSRTIIRCELSNNINQIRTQDNELVVNVSGTTGVSVLSFSSRVPLAAKTISTNGGIKRFLIEATSADVNITSI